MYVIVQYTYNTNLSNLNLFMSLVVELTKSCRFQLT